MKQQIEQLEQRKLLSATLTGGTLAVTGTASNDQIYVSLSSDGDTVTVTQAKRRNGRRTGALTTTEFAASDVTAITIDAGKGNDVIAIRSLDRDVAFEVPVSVLGGAGNDRIATAAGNDTVSGGDGDDEIRLGAGDDSALGGDGDDRINGGDGADNLSGEAGDDRLDGGAGIDSLFGGDDDDVLVTAGDDAIDIIDGGADSAGTDEDDQDIAIADDDDTITAAVLTTLDDLPHGNDHHGHHGGRHR